MDIYGEQSFQDMKTYEIFTYKCNIKCTCFMTLSGSVNEIYGIRRSLIVIGSITEVKRRRARFIIGWVTAWWLPGAVYTRGA